MAIKQKGNFWNLSEYLRRLGLQTAGEQPQLLDSVQPVLIAGDVSGLTTPFVPALAWAGRLFIGTVAERTGFAIRSNSPGGTFIRSLRLSTSDAGTWIWNILEPPVPHVFSSGGLALPLIQMGPVDCNALVRVGSTVSGTLSANTEPTISSGSNMALFIDEFYLAPHQELYGEIFLDNLGMSIAVLLQDVPVQIPGGD